MSKNDYQNSQVFINKILGNKVTIPISGGNFINDFWSGVRILEYDTISKLDKLERYVILRKFNLNLEIIQDDVDGFEVLNENLVDKIARKCILKLKKMPQFILLKDIILGCDKNIEENDISVMKQYFSNDFVEFYLSKVPNNKFFSILKIMRNVESGYGIILTNRQKRVLNQYNVKTIEELIMLYDEGKIKKLRGLNSESVKEICDFYRNKV